MKETMDSISHLHFFRFLHFLFIVLISAATAPDCMGAHAGESIQAPEYSTRWPACDNTSDTQTISFVHVADVHAHYNPDRSGMSPLARVRGFYEKTRQENPFTVFTNAGDDYEKGSIAEALSRGRSTRQVVQAMGYDVRTLGNHDFAWDLAELLEFSRDPSAVVLAANAILENTPSIAEEAETPGWTDYTVLTVGCVRVGVFGLVSRPWNEKDEQYDGSIYPGSPELQADFDYAGIAGRIIAKHRLEVDLLVLVSHLGIEEDVRLAERTRGIDLILGGHSHTTMTQALHIGDTSIVHAGACAEHVGRVDIEYDLLDKRIRASHFTLVPNDSQTMPVDKPAAAALEEILAPYREEISREFSWLNVAEDKSSMAQIAARAVVETMNLDAAFVGAHSVWTEWHAGGVTQQNVLDAFVVERQPAGQPGCSSVYLLEVTGENLLHMKAALSDFAFRGPQVIVPSSSYTIALQKPQAFRQLEYFGRQISSSAPEPAAELWEMVVAFGRVQSAANLSLNETYPSPGADSLIAFLSPIPALRSSR